MKATSGQLPRGDAWRYEPKWDGHRAVVRVRDGTITAASSTGKDRSAAWSWLTETLAHLPDCVIDGEVVAFDEHGRHSFQLVGNAARDHALVVFDVLQVGDERLLGVEWGERRARLDDLITPAPRLIVTPVGDDGDAMHAVTSAQAFEGLVAKRLDSLYLPGRRSTSWIKVKHRHVQEFVVGGVLRGAGRRAGTFGSLLVGIHDAVGSPPLRFVGAVGSGLSDQALTQFAPQVTALRADHCPFDPVPRLPQGSPTWMQPDVVVQVEFAEWTAGGHLRHPVFRGFRHDVDPASVTRSP